MFANLLINAAKYTDPGGRIQLRAWRDGQHVAVAVCDNGIGISPDMMSRLFTPFFQARSALERSEGGLGIGLALVRGLVTLHGGTVEARSEGPQRGSEFIVRLPSGTAVPQPQQAGVDSNAAPAAPSSPLRVIVADDNRDSAETCAALLQLCGHQVQIAHTGREALELAESLHPHAMLLDIGMPELDGYTLAGKIRGTAWGRGVTLIAITGWGQEDDKRRALAAGFNHHLTKPIDPNTLEALLHGVGASA
ncbi:MAG: response regulator [Gammaproteobacteria bacterium]|nr:MAG: response regulator [Gammaproteobacteria bacterium]